MNVYDFDKTICFKDSTFAFWKYCVLRKPWLVLLLPIQCIGAIPYCLKLTKKLNAWWMYIRFVNVNDAMIKNFADKHERYICDWYLQQKHPDDVIVSASPAFLIKEFAQRLGVTCVASDVDIETGRYHKPSCSGKEKVKQFRAVYPNAEVYASYGNAESDQYIMREGQHAYLVRNFSRTDADFQQWN